MLVKQIPQSRFCLVQHMLGTASHVANVKSYIEYRTAVGRLPSQTGRSRRSVRLSHAGYRLNRQTGCFILIGVTQNDERNSQSHGFL